MIRRKPTMARLLTASALFSSVMISSVMFASVIVASALIVVPAAVVPRAADAASSRNGIRSVDFRNFVWDLDDGTQIETHDGVADRGSLEDGDLVHFEVLDVDHGDIDGDGEEEAVVTTLMNTGGTGQFTDAVVFRFTGRGPVRVTSHGVGDRADGGVHNVVIVDGIARIDRYTKGEGACCPTVLSTYFVRLKANKLVTAKPTTSRATMYLGTGPDATTTKIEFLRGTSTANISGSASDAAGGYFNARAGQTVTFQVLKAEGRSLSGAVRLSYGGKVLVQVPQGSTRTLRLPGTGTYRIALVQTRAARDPSDFSWVEFEFTIR